MAFTTEVAFDQFFSLINLPGDYREIANRRADWIASRLRGNGLTVLTSFPMGSIPRYTALKDHSDLDVMVALHYAKHIKDRKPSAVLLTVRNALGSAAGSVRRNGQAVTMSFSSWPDVDVVPASRIVDNNGAITSYEIPDMNREVWIATKPASHSAAINDEAGSRGPNFRRVIKMLKDWNRRQAVSIQSYHLEVIALKLDCSWSDHSWPILQWFDKSQGYLDYCWNDGDDVSEYLTPERRQTIRRNLQSAHNAALSAWYAEFKGNHPKAISEWKSVFGQKFPSYG